MKTKMKIAATLLISILAVNAYAWNTTIGEEVCPIAPHTIVYDWDFEVFDDGSIAIGWNGPGSEGRGIATYFNRYDKEGNCLFADGAMLVSELPTKLYTVINQIMYVDREENTLLAYQTHENALNQGVTHSETTNYRIYKISPEGEMLWGDKGLDLNSGGYSSNTQACLTFTQIADGSYFFAYVIYEFVGETEVGTIYLERISEDGEFLWDTPMKISGGNTPVTYPYLIDAGNNQVLLVYAKGYDQELAVKKLDFDGTEVWGKDTVVYQDGFGTIPVWTFLKVMSDGKGGVFIGWYDDRNYTNYERTYVAHVNSEGQHTFASGVGGEAVGYSEGLRSFSPAICYDSESDYLYVLRQQTSMGQDYAELILQKISMSGELMWNEGEGVEIFPYSQTFLGYESVCDNGDGNLAVFYMENQKEYEEDNVTAYKIVVDKESGEIVSESPLPFTLTTENRQSLKISPLIDNEYHIAMWEDKRILPEDDTDVDITMLPRRLYMQRIFNDGSIGLRSSVDEIGADKDLTISVSDGAIEIATASTLSDVTIEVVDIAGVKKMSVGVDAVSQRYMLPTQGLQPGVYIITISGDTIRKSFKTIIK